MARGLLAGELRSLRAGESFGSSAAVEALMNAEGSMLRRRRRREYVPLFWRVAG